MKMRFFSSVFQIKKTRFYNLNMGIHTKFSIALNSFKTAHYFFKKHRLWHFVFIPGIINLFFFISFLMWLLGNVNGWVDAVFEWDCENEDGWMYYSCEVFSTTLVGMKFIFSWAVKSIFIMIYLAVYKSIILIFYSPVIAYLIEIVDQKNRGIELPFAMEQFLKDTVRGVSIAIRNILLECICIVVILTLTFVPVVNLTQPIMFWLVSAYFLGFSMMDYSLERKRLSARSSINYIKRNKSMAVGVGSIFQLMYLVPFIGWMFAPTYAAVAAYFAIEELEKNNI